ncbi:MAG TPA: RagB/SusD family nutrient uptake outer membrane protein, partial [Cyclobacteriaceae bacterium]|nr:RagB/SusD family nutrient uptake outer membrane protein [Cyclobacteriaceae bacterium]
ALFYLNQVRVRAGLAPSALTGTALFDQIIHERRVEFLHENKRWFDLLRTGTAVSVMQAFGNAFRADPNNPNPPDITPAGAYQPANILTKLVYPLREVQVLGFTPPVGG